MRQIIVIWIIWTSWLKARYNIFVSEKVFKKYKIKDVRCSLSSWVNSNLTYIQSLPWNSSPWIMPLGYMLANHELLCREVTLFKIQFANIKTITFVVAPNQNILKVRQVFCNVCVFQDRCGLNVHRLFFFVVYYCNHYELYIFVYSLRCWFTSNFFHLEEGLYRN